MKRMTISVKSGLMRAAAAAIASLLWVSSASAESDVDPQAIWERRCDQCHGDAAEFAHKRLWSIDGQLHGSRHAVDMHRFLSNHHLRVHEIESVIQLLLASSNSTARFDAECGSCHGSASEFVEKSLWVRRDSISGLGTGSDVAEFLLTHQDLSPEDASFFFDLLLHVGNAR